MRTNIYTPVNLQTLFTIGHISLICGKSFPFHSRSLLKSVHILRTPDFRYSYIWCYINFVVSHLVPTKKTKVEKFFLFPFSLFMMRTLHKLPSFKTQFTKWGDIQVSTYFSFVFILVCWFLFSFFSVILSHPSRKWANSFSSTFAGCPEFFSSFFFFLLTMTKSLIVSIYAFVCDNISQSFHEIFHF